VEKTSVATSRTKIAMHISLVTIVINALLAAGKLAAGIIGHSAAMISDAIHSASDVFATFIVMAGVKMSGKKADGDHQYGHERLECAASIVLAAILALTGVAIGWSGAEKIISGNTDEIAIPTALPLAAAVISIVVKEAMYWYTRHYAKKLDSDALMADAWHHRSDALSSIGSFAGILGARMGYPVLDPLASIVISLMIIAAAVSIFKGSLDRMVDRSCSQEEYDAIYEAIASTGGVEHIDLLRTRLFGSRLYVDTEVSARDDLTLVQSHAIAEDIHRRIEKKFPDVKHCMVHINPISEEIHDF